MKRISLALATILFSLFLIACISVHSHRGHHPPPPGHRHHDMARGH